VTEENEKADGFTQAEWTAAMEMHFRNEPKSPQAERLVTLVLEAAASAAKAPEKQERTSRGARRRKALGAVLADLLKLEVDGKV
jgi:hypothetical protein